ncbi:sulfatase [candidate division KSB1 bacterium]|nr:sulfatase [candidate division KSB1 bacterium]
MRLLYLDLDTLRADHLGCYGYHRNTSPNIDQIAGEGVRFDQYYCSDAPCLPSRTALMTGRFGIHTGVVGHAGTAADNRLEGAKRGFRSTLSYTSLPATLKQAGLYTVFIGGFGERHSAFPFYAGFREIYDTGLGGMESAEDVTPAALDWIARNAQKDNWYLHINYWDPHTPYRAPEDFGNPFEKSPLPEWLTPEIVAAHRMLPGPHTAQDIGMYDNRTNPRYPRHPGEIKDMAGLRRIIDGYDCGIRYMDQHIGQLFEALRKEGIFDDLAIIISADHGENQGELGIYAEHATADNITCRIPMIVRMPGGMNGHIDTGLHYNLDLVPTLAELLNQQPKPIWDGQSYAPAILRGEDCGRDQLILSQCAHVCQRSVRWDSNLYMRTYHDGYHLFPDEMLFDVKKDPHEQKNLAADRSDLCREGAHRLAAWHDQMLRTMPEGFSVDPMRTVLLEGGPAHANGQLKKYCERLERTGRGSSIEMLKKRHPREFGDT